MAVWKVATHFCLTLIIKELKISVEQGRVVTTLNIINTLNILFGVVVLPRHAFPRDMQKKIMAQFLDVGMVADTCTNSYMDFTNWDGDVMVDQKNVTSAKGEFNNLIFRRFGRGNSIA